MIDIGRKGEGCDHMNLGLKSPCICKRSASYPDKDLKSCSWV